jgi:predicted RNase H-like nuclease (RuvC/YqgF family)
MSPEEKHKINVWIPGSLWKQIGGLGYESPTKATIAAFEALVLKENTGSNQEGLGSIQEEIRKYQEEIGRCQETIIPNLEKQIIEAQNQVKDIENKLKGAPDPIELADIRARYEGLQVLLEEKDKRINDLTREVEGLKDGKKTMEEFAHYFKSSEIKQIEAPAAEKKKPWYKIW